jgi:hypothetical protein
MNQIVTPKKSKRNDSLKNTIDYIIAYSTTIDMGNALEFPILSIAIWASQISVKGPQNPFAMCRLPLP